MLTSLKNSVILSLEGLRATEDKRASRLARLYVFGFELG